MPASRSRAGEVLRYLIKAHVAMHDLEKQLRGALQPSVEAAYADAFQNGLLIKIP